jgi:hypothetical protein
MAHRAMETEATTNVSAGCNDNIDYGIFDVTSSIALPGATATINKPPPCSGCGCPAG